MTPTSTFPFGQPVHTVTQTDRTPRHVFILGVYASAVHARWINASGKTVVNALAVASEPYIFWRGDNAESTIQQITIPQALGKLLPARAEFNGPSGIALDNLILNPLGLDRSKIWLCDLVPQSCANPSQSKAIQRAYLPLVQKYGLSIPTVPPVPRQLTDENRRKAIVDELIESQAGVLVLLGDKPIQWFLRYFDNRWKMLSDFGMEEHAYGQLHSTQIGSIEIKVLPLAHHRQIARLGQSSPLWYNRHQRWVRQTANKISL